MEQLNALIAKLTALAESVKGGLPQASVPTIGSRFKGLCIVGLNKAELLPYKGEPSVFADNWQGLIDDSMRRSTALIFFAPRDLSGTPVNPFLFLGGDELDDGDEDEQALFMQTLGSLALLDFCRIPRARGADVGMILAADALFHWDNEDNYIIPVTTTGWVHDVKRIVGSYPKNANITLFTNWETGIYTDPPSNVNIRPLTDAPLPEAIWVNQPTFQEKHGTAMLLAGVAFAALVGGVLYLQQRQLNKLDEQIGIVEQEIPREGKYMRLARPIREQEAQMRYRHLLPLTIEDTARTIEVSEMKVDNFEVRNPKPQDPPTQLIATIEAERDAYKGWLQEEPVAKNILLNSTTYTGLRKPPGNSFKLEGLIDLRQLDTDMKAALRRQTNAVSPAATSTPVAEEPAKEGGGE